MREVATLHRIAVLAGSKEQWRYKRYVDCHTALFQPNRLGVVSNSVIKHRGLHRRGRRTIVTGSFRTGEGTVFGPMTNLGDVLKFEASVRAFLAPPTAEAMGFANSPCNTLSVTSLERLFHRTRRGSQV